MLRLVRRRWFQATLVVLVAFATFVFVHNASFGSGPGEPLVLAHRGLHQTFDRTNLEWDTCTAGRMDPPAHDYQENTTRSMRAAFEAGADIVEFDVRVTADGRFAVFHDWMLECRTDGTGDVEDHPMAALRELDIAHGYTADGGSTYPFRGTGVGQMPELAEVFDAFEDPANGELLLHVKDPDARVGALLADRLRALPERMTDRLTVYGEDDPIDVLATKLPELRVMSKATMQVCLRDYLAVGWTGRVPDACAHTQLHIPENIAPWLWGWPAKFTARMAERGTRVVLVADGSGSSAGFDSVADLDRLPAGFDGVVWTNRAEVVAPALRER